MDLPQTRNVLLTGRPGCGKTTVIRLTVEGAGSAGGFYTAEIREGGRRTGFSINTLDGREGILAGADIESGIRVGRYSVNIKDLDGIAVASIESALRDEEKTVIVIDEIASMEMSSDLFKGAVRSALDSEKCVLGSIQSKNDRFLDEVRSREDVTVLDVTASNRDRLPSLLKSWTEVAAE